MKEDAKKELYYDVDLYLKCYENIKNNNNYATKEDQRIMRQHDTASFICGMIHFAHCVGIINLSEFIELGEKVPTCSMNFPPRET